jgi:glycosyltransferase involved in cell wall biosynthesis
MSQALFTVVVPTHNRPLLLQRAITSLANQTFQDFFLVIVDDAGSYLPPYEALKSLQNRYAYVIYPSLKGPSQSRDLGVQMAESDFVLFLDDDDTYQPNHLEMIAKKIDRSSQKIHFTNFTIINEERNTSTTPTTISTQSYSIADVTRDDIYVLNRIPNCCLVFPSSVVKSVEHDSTLKVYEDWDYLLHCLEGHELAHLDIASVNIHKCEAVNDSNLRRGNRGSHLAREATEILHQRYKSPNSSIESARKRLFEMI